MAVLIISPNTLCLIFLYTIINFLWTLKFLFKWRYFWESMLTLTAFISYFWSLWISCKNTSKKKYHLEAEKLRKIIHTPNTHIHTSLFSTYNVSHTLDMTHFYIMFKPSKKCFSFFFIYQMEKGLIVSVFHHVYPCSVSHAHDGRWPAVIVTAGHAHWVPHRAV